MQPTQIIQPQDEFVKLVQAMASRPNASAEVVQLAADIVNGTKKLVPETIYVRFILSGKSQVDFFDPSQGQNRQVGVYKLDSGKLPNGMFFMPISVQIQAVVKAALVDGDLKNLIYGGIGSLSNGSLRNAELDLTVDSFPILKDFALMNFETANNANVRSGEYYLPTRRLFEPQREIRGSIKAPAGSVFLTDLAGEVALHGIATSVVKSN